MKTLIRNAHVISPGIDLKRASVVIEKGRIRSVTADAVPKTGFDTVVDVRGKYLVPGFIDVHTHGACGHDVCDATPEAIAAIAAAKLAEGCTSFLPTTLTVANRTLKAAARAVAAYRRDERFAKALGIHLEGPFINPACCGAQNPAFVRRPSIREVLGIAAISPVKLVSFAPEMTGGTAFAAACRDHGIVPSCGHTGATFAQFLSAYDAGLRHLTHFCNQMTKLHHREIGIVGAGFLLDDLNTEVICDRIHLCDDMLRLVFWKRDLAHVQMIFRFCQIMEQKLQQKSVSEPASFDFELRKAHGKIRGLNVLHADEAGTFHRAGEAVAVCRFRGGAAMLRSGYSEIFPADRFIAGAPLHTAGPAALVAEKLRLILERLRQRLQLRKRPVQTEIRHNKLKFIPPEFILKLRKLRQHFCGG